MPGSSITKKALADAMKELMRDIPMEKIKIRDIVQHCGMNRQSFYYHFKDKYDLVNWIFYSEFVSSIQKEKDAQGWDIFQNICSFLYNNRQFYSNALRVKSQNSFEDYLGEVTHSVIAHDLKGYFMNHENQEFCATFLTDAICIAIKRWLLDEAKSSPVEFVELIKTTISGLTNKLVGDTHIDEH